MQAKKLHLLILMSLLIVGRASAEQPTATPVSITVADPTGTGVRGATIRVVPAPDPPPKMETDRNGQLALNLKPGSYALFARAQGFKTCVMHFDVPKQKEVQTVRAVVQIAPSGAPMVVASGKNDLTLITYPYHEPAEFSPAQLKAMPHTTVTVHNSHTNADETYSGVRLADLLTKMNAPLGNELRGEALENYIVASGADGYEAVFSLAELDPSVHPGEVLVADAMDGKPLDQHNGPFKLVVTEDKRPARSVRNLTTIALRAAQ